MPTANDKAWERYITANHLSLDGSSYEIDAARLKEITGREPRLLTKFDDPSQLPRILRDKGYSVIAIANGSYLLFKGSVFASVTSCPTQSAFKTALEFPLVTVGRGTGESEYLDNAYNTGILSQFAQSGKLYLTIRGRERTRPVSFSINASGLSVNVDGVQIEPDAGYEGERDVVLIEAKIGNRAHFNIRQLYYPFRHFSIVAPRKQIRTLLFEYDLVKATYTFHEFVFPNPFVFDSIQQSRCCVYTLTLRAPYRIDELMDTRFETTSQNVPQADDLNKVLELLTLINGGQNTVSDVADYFVFDARQSRYYGEAAEYLGLITRHRGIFEMTKRGSEFISVPPSEQQTFIARLVMNSWVFREVIKRARRKGYFTITDIEEVIATAQTRGKQQRYTSTTIPRRRQTIVSWVTWLADQIGCFQIDGDKYRLA